MVTLADKPRPSHLSLAWRQVADEVILVDPTQADTVVRVFNGVAGAIWLKLDGDHDLATVAQTLAHTYDASESAIQEDVIAFVGELVAMGVLVLV